MRAGCLAAMITLANPRLEARENPWELQIQRPIMRLTAVHAMYGRFWAAGERGAFYTSPKGKLWTKLKPFTEKNLYGVSFVEPDIGCVVGEGGLIATTESSGEQWTVQQTGVTVDLRDVSFGNRNVGCAVGLKGTLLMTYDGGRTWLQKDAGYGESFFGVTMVSPHEAWVVGERGMILHTQNAGRSWSAERHPSGRWLYDVAFNEGVGWAVGQSGFILRYMLNKWEEIPLPSAAYTLYGVGAQSDRSVCVVGAGGQVWNTDDAGMSWQRRESQTKEDLTAIALSGKMGWVVGAENALYATIDGGDSWAVYMLAVLPSYTDGRFTDSSAGWVVGRYGLILNTRDGGETWGQQDSGAKHHLLAVYPVSRRLCYAAGERVILKTDNGGLSWRRVYKAPPPSLEEMEKSEAERKPELTFNGLYFFDKRRGWAVGTGGCIMYTGSEGEYWKRLRTGIEHTLHAVWFLSPAKGFVTDDVGQLYMTTSGGRRWTAKVIGGGGEPLRSIFFLDADHGWIVGDGGAILKTQDGGATWKEIRLGGAIALHAVWFVDPMTGWLAGERGLLMKTWDGGSTWVSEKPPVQTDYVGLYFTSPEHGWAIGRRGVILGYRR